MTLYRRVQVTRAGLSWPAPGAVIRGVGRLLLGIVLCVPYMLGWAVGFVVLTGLTVGTAARLGWSDARKRGDRGSA
jgi:hypothetical protein